MARSSGDVSWKPPKYKKRTSVGKSKYSKPKNRGKKRSYKKYRGQGR